MPDNNGRVTLAVIKRDLEYIREDIREIKAELGKEAEIHADHEKRITKNEEKLSNSTVIQLAFATVMSAIATWLGVKN